MKMIGKKIFTVLLCLSLSCTMLAGCGDGAVSNGDAPDDG